MIPVRLAVQLLGLWLFLVVVSLFSRSYIPIDETRYVTVAWNMWLRGDFLVPFINGEPYSHKPPLLFWMMNLGWAVFGVNDWWPRLVPSFFALGATWLTVLVARRLWPELPKVAQIAPMILLGSILWTVFTTATMFDMLVAFFTLLGMFGILVVWQDKSFKGWLILGLAIGGGLLAKGPTILLQLLPLAVLAPWWGKGQARAWGRWYLGILGAILMGTAIALAWAIPAGIRGGETYQHAIFWGQTADRMVNSFAHRRSLWWYVPLLPVMLFPWLLWLPVWRGFAKLHTVTGDFGVRFSLAWLVPVFLAFSFISGKQMHYLLPIFPAFALLVAYLVVRFGGFSRIDALPAAIASMAVGAGLIYLPVYAQHHALAPWINDIPPLSGLVLIGGGVLAILMRQDDLLRQVWKMTLLSALAATLLYVEVIRVAGTAYDVRPISHQLKQLQDAGVPLAHAGRYHGMFNFIGRLTDSPDVSSRDQLSSWFDAHPNGRAIVYFNHGHPLGNLKPEYLQAYQGDQVGIVNREQWVQWWAAHRSAQADAQDDAGDEGR